jgi:lysylphosphatidylglycerol synthetase-like protein (DUF2156 family)
MSISSFELRKLVLRRFSVGLLIGTIVLFPLIVKVISYLSVIKDNVPEGLFANNVIFGIHAYSQTYIFLPVWIISLVGLELSNGHVNRVVFLKSRKFYFLSKLYFSLIVTLLFTFLGLIALIISIETSPFIDFKVDPILYIQFLIQYFFSTLLFCLILLSLVFIFRSPIKTFIIYFIWTFVEGILYSFFDGIYKIELKWLPLHLVRTLYSINGEVQLQNYYNPFITHLNSLILPFAFIGFILAIVYSLFIKGNLQALSD